jgi:hypothetical protein
MIPLYLRFCQYSRNWVTFGYYPTFSSWNTNLANSVEIFSYITLSLFRDWQINPNTVEFFVTLNIKPAVFRNPTLYSLIGARETWGFAKPSLRNTGLDEGQRFLWCGGVQLRRWESTFPQNQLPLFRVETWGSLSTLKMEVAGSAETSILIYETVLRHIIENIDLHLN